MSTSKTRAPGGGRKPSPSRGVPLGLTVPPSIAEQLQREAEQRMIPASRRAVQILILHYAAK